MIREKISYKDFHRIAKENECFLWHFLQKNQHKHEMELFSITEEKKVLNPLKVLLEYVDIPYFESYTEDSIDFLNDFGFEYKHLWTRKNKGMIHKFSEFQFRPIMIGFKGYTKVFSTFETCYCLDGVLNILDKLDSKYTEQVIKNI